MIFFLDKRVTLVDHYCPIFIVSVKTLHSFINKDTMFGMGYAKPVQSAVDDDDDEGNMLGGGKSDFPNANDDFRTRMKNNSNGSSGFGSSDYGSSDKDPFKVDKDAWLKGNDKNDPFKNKNSGGNSLFGDPFKKSSSNSNSSGGFGSGGGYGNNSSGGFGSGSMNSSANYNDPFAAPNSPPKLPDYYVSDTSSGMDQVYCCVSCYAKMTKKLATNILKLKPNDNSVNYGGSMSTLCDICQKNVREIREAINSGSPINTTGIGNDMKGAFPRPNAKNDSRSSGDRGPFGGGDGRTSFGNDGRGSMDSRGSDDMSSGMIRMQPAGKSNSVFGGMFSGSKKKY